jgi:hypothetical protein
MELTIRKSDGLDDWYLIERAVHIQRTWDEHYTTPGGMGVSFYCTSARICGEGYGDTPPGHSADVEGTCLEMLAIANAIELGDAVRFKRCGVDARSEPVRISSPRNGNGFDAEVTRAEALDLARKIREMLSK